MNYYRKLRIGEVITEIDFWMMSNGARFESCNSIGKQQTSINKQFYRPITKKSYKYPKNRIDMEFYLTVCGLDEAQKKFIKNLIYNFYRRRVK